MRLLEVELVNLGAKGDPGYCNTIGGRGYQIGTPSFPKDPGWCSQADVDAALAAVEKRIDDKTVDDSNDTSGLSVIARHPKSTPPQKSRALQALRKHIDTVGAYQRSTAVRELTDADPDGLAFLQKYANDPELKSAIASARERAKSLARRPAPRRPRR